MLTIKNINKFFPLIIIIAIYTCNKVELIQLEQKIQRSEHRIFIFTKLKL